MSERCIVIAEAGVNHNGSLDLAHQLVDVAAQAGADFVKFQTFRTEALVTREAPKADYQKRTTGHTESQFEMLKRLELDENAFRELAVYAKSKGIGFLSTPFDIESARFLTTLGVSAFKVSSGDLTNIPFLRELASMGLPIILSSGMATLGELEEAVEACEQAGVPIDKLTLLHCTTEYPAPAEEINLRAMLTIAAAFPGATFGYSDHTEGIEIPIAAAAMGAQVVEKHFTLDRTMEGPDHKASLEPAELAAMVRAIRRVGVALGDGRKRPTASELPNRQIARKSLVAARPIAKGETFTAQNLSVRRPGNGISPARWDSVIGQPAARDYAQDELI
ncbi:N-acetylneuraminate synthase [Paraburkholderia sp. BL21I4N1]|uniref:N-acetylneuraminate synthase n=1 Tax=Paraburkholderia sp. BL21I4N1 TaxID=1938801 RepID=UPI000CFD331E|nr:N-acetylneuraminate synthase [Paraburkholderia sp. BL21I4N1]PQV52507.1 N-acetylneuraminate synthase [Paraburkholderia sp. BL21I4N1]